MLVGCGIDNLIFHRGQRLVRLLVEPEIINLEPEIDLFLLGKRSRLAVGRLHLGTDFVGPNDEVAGADFARRDWLHLVGQDQRGGSELFVAEIGDGIGAAEDAVFVAVDVFHHDVKPVKARTHGKRLPIKRDVVDFFFQQLGGNILAERFFKGLYDLAGKLGELAVNVDHGTLNAIFVGESKAFKRDLQRDGNQDRVRGQLHEINLHVKGQQVDFVKLTSDTDRKSKRLNSS